MLAPDIVEIDVDALRRGGGERLDHRPGLVIDHLVGAERAHELAFVRPAGRTDHGQPARLGDLHHRRSDRARRRRHEQHVAPLGLRRVEQSEIGRPPGQPKIAEERLRRRAEVRKLVKRIGGHDRFVAPSGHVQHLVTGLEPGVAAFDHFTDRAALHRGVDLEWRDVTLHVVHPPAHIGVDRQIAVADLDHAFGHRGQRVILYREVLHHGHAVGSPHQVPGSGHILSPLSKVWGVA